MKKAAWILSALALGALVLPNFVFAVQSSICIPGNDLDPGCVTNIKSVNDVVSFLFRILFYVRTIFWILAVAMILYSAYLFLFGGAGEKNVGAAKSALRFAVIAIIVALLATAIPWLVKSILGG